MPTDWVARGIAISHAASSFGAIARDVISWRRSGPVLKAAVDVSGR
jgi:hypothetical protein